VQRQQAKQPKLEWLNIGSSWSIVVPIKTQAGDGRYAIDIIRRPVFCNHGDWLIRVSGYNSDLNGQDSFPRYFFGTADEAKAQMEAWLNRREAYRAALK
jgi:hypothetical protein